MGKVGLIMCIRLYTFLFVLSYSFVCAADPLVKKDDRIWLIGDSNGFLLMQELPKIANSCGIKLSGNPVGGSSVISWSFQLDDKIRELNRFKPTVILICLGSNDAYMGPAIIKNELPYLNKFLFKISKPERKIIWIGPPDLQKKRIGVEAFYQMVNPISVYLDSRQIKIDMWDDLLHPSFVGRKVWAEWIWEILVK